jgi:dCMP deaminase
MRPSRDTTLMGVARLWAEHSTCSRLAVGAVVSRDGRSVATGYNGAPAGLPHCDHSVQVCFCTSGNPLDYEGPLRDCPSHGDRGCTTAVHAELNALMFAARYGVATDGAELHCTHQPCLNCAMAIINAGIIRVVYATPYRDPAGLYLLQRAGIAAERLVG